MSQRMTVEEARRAGLLPAGEAKRQGSKATSQNSFRTTLPYPPSVNHYWRTFRGRMIVSKEGRDYRNEVEVYRPIDCFTGRLIVTIKAWMPDKRRRDIDNLNKAILDAMTHAGFWADDSLIDDLRIIRAGVEKPGRVEVFIQEQTK